MRGGMRMEDTKIIELYLERKENAILETQNKYNKYLMNIADNILHDYFEDEECVNDTYFKTWRAIPPTVPISLKAFVGKITRNNALNRIRDKNRDKRVINYISEQLNELESVFVVKTSVEDQFHNKQIEEILKQFLYELPQDKRVIAL